MSYSRSFSKTIAVHYSGSISYPASEHGGTRSYSGTVYETVDVNVHVDTTPFDHEIASCNNDVNILTGAVMATEEAQVISIDKNAKKIGKTIVDGFFNTVRSEITQQIAELKARIEATLIHLNEMAKQCAAKQQQMTSDYQRLCQRYGKLFQDLNNELENRIYMLDEPAFRFNRTAEALAPGNPKSDMISTASVGHAEHASAQSRIAASVAKRRAVHAIRQAHSFITTQQNSDRLISKVLMRSDNTGSIYAPTAYFESTDSPERLNQQVFTSRPISVNPSALKSKMETAKWKQHFNDATINSIRREYNTCIAENISGITDHEKRVIAYMGSLFNLTDTSTLSNQ